MSPISSVSPRFAGITLLKSDALTQKTVTEQRQAVDVVRAAMRQSDIRHDLIGQNFGTDTFHMKLATVDANNKHHNGLITLGMVALQTQMGITAPMQKELEPYKIPDDDVLDIMTAGWSA